MWVSVVLRAVERRQLQNVGQSSSGGGGAETTTECGSA